MILYELALAVPIGVAVILMSQLDDASRLGEAALYMLLVYALTALPVFLVGTWLAGRNFARLLRPLRH